MKKIISVLLIFSLAFSLFACASEEKSDDKMKYSGELFGPVKIADGVEDVYVGLDTAFVHIFRESDKENPVQSFTTSGFDDIENSARSIRAADVDFDGFNDLIIPFRRVADYQYYYVYTWNNDSETFSLVSSMSAIGNVEVCDGYIKGVSSEHGAYHLTKYYWVDGVLEEEEELDETMSIARECAEGILKKDGLTVTFGRDELVGMTLTKLYFIMDGGKTAAYVAVSYDGTRAFWSSASDVYFEVVRDGDEFKNGQSYSKMEYTGVPHGYAAEEYAKLNASAKEYYDMISDKLLSFAEIDFDSADAADAMEAYMKDHPVRSMCFVPKIMGNSVTGDYVAAWDNYNTGVTKDELAEGMSAYSDKISAIISEMPTGLEPIERYVYLAQKLQVLSDEEHHHGKDGDGLGIYIPGNSLNEKAAKTYTYMCEKAELYCVWDGEHNVIMDGTEKRIVSVYDAFAYPAGSDGWLDTFFAEED